MFLFTLSYGKDSQLRLEYMETKKFPSKEIFFVSSDYFSGALPCLSGLLSQYGWPLSDKMENTLVFSLSGEPEYEKRIVSDIKLSPIQFIDSQTVLLISISEGALLQWSIVDNKPLKKMKLSYEFLPYMANCFDNCNKIVVTFWDTYKFNEKKTLGGVFDFGKELDVFGKCYTEFVVTDENLDSFEAYSCQGKGLNDQRVFIISMFDSRLLEFDLDGSLNFVYDPIEDFKVVRNMPKTPERVDKVDHLTCNNQLPIMHDKLLFMQRNFFRANRFIDIWDINHRKYIGKIDIGKRCFVGVLDDEIWVIDSLDSVYFYIGLYKLKYPEDTTRNICQYRITEPLSGKKVNLATCLPKYEDTLIIINTTPYDYLAIVQEYISRHSAQDGYVPPIPCIILYTSPEPEILISLKNSGVDRNFYMILNTDLSLKEKFPYAIVLNKRGDIVRELSEKDVVKILSK